MRDRLWILHRLGFVKNVWEKTKRLYKSYKTWQIVLKLMHEMWVEIMNEYHRNIYVKCSKKNIIEIQI